MTPTSHWSKFFHKELSFLDIYISLSDCAESRQCRILLKFRNDLAKMSSACEKQVQFRPSIFKSDSCLLWELGKGTSKVTGGVQGGGFFRNGESEDVYKTTTSSNQLYSTFSHSQNNTFSILVRERGGITIICHNLPNVCSLTFSQHNPNPASAF